MSIQDAVSVDVGGRVSGVVNCSVSGGDGEQKVACVGGSYREGLAMSRAQALSLTGLTRQKWVVVMVKVNGPMS